MIGRKPLVSCLPHTVQPVWLFFPARCPVRVRLFHVLLGQPPSLHDLLPPSLAFVRPLHRYYAAVRLPAAVHLGLIALRLLPTVRVLPTTDGNGVSRFSCVKFLYMLGVFDSAGPNARSRLRTHQCGLPCSLTPSAPGLRDFGAHYFGIPRLLMPLPNASSAWLPAALAWFWGQDGSLLLSCMTLPFTTSRRFIPTLSKLRLVPRTKRHKKCSRESRMKRLCVSPVIS